MSTPPDHTTRTGAAGAGTFALGGDRVNRLGFGAMRLPADRGRARALLRRVVELGVRLVDTAEFYGPGTSEELIAEALWPYPDGLVIATKGLTHPPDRWGQQGNPGRLREAVEGSLRRLRLERIDLYQLARIDPTVPAADFGVLAELRTGQDPPRGALRGRGRAGRGGAQARAGGLGAEPLQPRRPGLGARRGPLRARGSRSCRGSPWARAGSPRRAGPWGGGAAPPGHAGPGRPGLAAAALPGHGAHPRHLLGGTPGGEPGRLDAAARRRRGPVVGLAVSRPTQPSAAGPTGEPRDRSRSGPMSCAISWHLVDETAEEGNWPPHRDLDEAGEASA